MRSRLRIAREKRAQKKQEKQEKQKQTEQTDEHPTDQDGEANNSENDGRASVAETLEEDSRAEQAAHVVMPTRLKARTGKTRFFANPIPFDRHLTALQSVGLHDNLKRAVLKGIPSESLQIVQGPPGTGKTRYLASLISSFSADDRILCCAPTSVAAANLYERVLRHCESAALLMPLSRIPADTPVTSQSPDARVVCSTVSGRSGTLLDGQEFDVVLVDEAAQCMEAWLWSVLRPTVHTIVMVGTHNSSQL